MYFLSNSKKTARDFYEHYVHYITHTYFHMYLKSGYIDFYSI